MGAVKAGKLPLDLLSRLLAGIPQDDPRVVVGPRAGEDAALIDFGDRYLAAKTDPITFATDLIGWYVVQVNANDLAAMGATPKWLMATLLFPEGTRPDEVEEAFSQLGSACAELGVTLVGGHTEITYGLSRPLAVGAMLGEVEKGREVLTSGARPGDSIVLTKGIAIEGAAVLARESAPELRSAGVEQQVIDRAAELPLLAGDQRRQGRPSRRPGRGRPRHARPNGGRPGHRTAWSSPRRPESGSPSTSTGFPSWTSPAPSAGPSAWTRSG